MRPFLIFIACLALYFGMLSILAMVAGAVSLEITGNATGIGTHTLEVLPDLANLTTEEATFLLGPGHNYNVTRGGLVTFQNGSSWQIIACEGGQA
jgi:hypothetical protein